MALPPITKVPLGFKAMTIPEIVIAGPPGLRVVPPIGIAVGFAAKVCPPTE